MSTIKIQKVSITDLDTDAVVNAANTGLAVGSGVCGAIFKAAGADQLQDACNQYGHCDVGAAVITPGFNLKAKYIIHAVGPKYNDGKHGEPQQLYGAYKKSLELAVANGCKSIGFPLISAGIYGYPLDGAWRKALQACRDFIENHPESSIDVVFAVRKDEIITIGQNTMKQVMSAGISSGHNGASSNALAQDWPVTAIPVVEHLQTGMGQVDAVYFHLTNEPNGYFSNWYPAAFVLDGIHYTSAEQYIMYQKCRLLGDIASAKDVLATDDVARQQRIGKQAFGYNANVWAGQRQIVALRGLTAKFSQNEELRRRLLETGDAWLVECAKSDKVWACGRRLTDDRRLSVSEWDGTNILGFALMEVRERLR